MNFDFVYFIRDEETFCVLKILLKCENKTRNTIKDIRDDMTMEKVSPDIAGYHVSSFSFISNGMTR